MRHLQLIPEYKGPDLTPEDVFILKVVTRVVIAFIALLLASIAGCAISNAGPTDQELCYQKGGNWTWTPDKSDNGLSASKTCVMPDTTQEE